MFIKLLFIYISTLLPIVYSLCYTNISETWICDGYDTLNTTTTANSDYEIILNNQQFKNFFLKNYYLSIFIIDNYPLTLHLLNASNNKFDKIIITSRNCYKSNLRHLILESNHIQQFNIDTIILPQSLEIISLANNHLEILDARIFSHLKDLIKLDLRNNQLKRISPQLLINIKIDFNNNPLDCQCTPEFYRIICEKSTNLKQSINESYNCTAPYYDPQQVDTHPASYLRFSTFTLICPINGQPPPIIIWSTPFGNLTSINLSNIDLLPFNNDKPTYVTITSLAGPFTARTRHKLHAFNTNRLSITQARASLQHNFSCSGINMLGIYTYKFNFNIETYAKKHALWLMMYTMIFALVMSLIGIILCIILKRTYYYSSDHMKTPPLYPTMTPNSAARTPPNFEINQWLSSAAANITGTLEQVRDILRSSVQQVSGTIRQAAESSAAYLQSFRETSQQRFNFLRVHTSSSLRSSGNFMRAGMNMLTVQVNSLRDYCGVTTGHLVPSNYLLQQQQLHNLQHSTSSILYVQYNQMPTIVEDNESTIEPTLLINPQNSSPFTGDIPSAVLTNGSGIGQLDTSDNSALLILNNLNQDTINICDNEDVIVTGNMIGGVGTFHDRNYDHNDELINESQRLINYSK
ncbi:unnamed protein product [Rotaria sp. Silwood2]|nr:unnamed protein product [Rotaria sp. Silwood2]CAF2983907.1 unnamed protein product [Rotaria sp. Silwood2]CAF3884242.1 unnamed protein product [Rotaria sp. Silwood2]CAF4155228.1 unnamed protein product [Rotaria sp. Silwood2]